MDKDTYKDVWESPEIRWEWSGGELSPQGPGLIRSIHDGRLRLCLNMFKQTGFSQSDKLKQEGQAGAHSPGIPSSSAPFRRAQRLPRGYWKGTQPYENQNKSADVYCDIKFKKKDKWRVGEMCVLHSLNNDRSLNQGFKLELFSFFLIYNLDTHKQICLLGSWQRLKPALLSEKHNFKEKEEVECLENRLLQRRVGQKGCRSSDYGLRHIGSCVQRLRVSLWGNDWRLLLFHFP